MEKKRDSFFLSKKPEKNSKHNDKKKDNFNNKRNEQFDKNKRNEQFDKTRALSKPEEKDNAKEKKPFDKQTYRLKKYSKKYKLEQWEEQRKKKLLRAYYKDVKNDPAAGSYKPKGFDEDTTDAGEVGRFVRHPDLIEREENEKPLQKIKKDPYHKAKEKLNQLKEEKLQKQQEIAKAKEEKQQKLQEYKKKKQERFKKLSKKTKKGQPVMTGRLELLLEKIQKGK